MKKQNTATAETLETSTASVSTGQMEPTARPWEKEGAPFGFPRLSAPFAPFGHTNNGHVIAEFYGPDAEANLELTRRAVNNFDALVDALKQFAECDLNEGNCASLEVATRRIRNVARKALSESAPNISGEQR